MTTYKGIDISNWQGSVDFSEVKNSGVQIVYIEATEGHLPRFSPMVEFFFNLGHFDPETLAAT